MAEETSSLSNLVKFHQVQGADCVAFDLESFVVSLNEDIGDAGPLVVKHVEPTEEGLMADDIGPNGAKNAVQAAESRADAIISEAQARASEVLNEAKEQGFQLGKEEGAQEAREEALKAVRMEVASTIRALQNAASELNMVREKALNDSDTEMLGLVLGVTRLVLSREIKTDKTLILEQIRRAAEILGEADEVTVKLHPHDLKVAQKNVDGLVPDGKSVKLSIVADKSVEQGGCLLECSRGTVDARISTQLERIEAAFDGVRGASDSAERELPAEQQRPAEADDA